MSARSLACLVTLSLVGLSQGQSLELGVTTGTLGPGISVSSALGDGWRVQIKGAYRTESMRQSYSREGFTMFSSDHTRSGAVGISIDREVAEGRGIVAGLWAVVAERTISLEPASALLAGLAVAPEDLGSVSVEVSVPQHPVPYVGAYQAGGLFGKWAARIDLGALYLGRAATEYRATGRLAPTASWLRETEKRASPARLTPVIQIAISLRLDAPTR